MKQLLLLSNGTMAGQGYLQHAYGWIAAHFHASTATPKTVLFIPYALHDYDSYTAKATDALSSIGINVVSARTDDDHRRCLNVVDGIVVGGGNTFRLLKKLQDSNILAAIKQHVDNGMPYVGVSAGTNIVGPTIKTTNDMPIVHPSSLNSLGLISVQINTHYVDGLLYYRYNGVEVAYNGETREARISEFHEENSVPVLGLREGSAISILGTKCLLLGDTGAVLFRKGLPPAEIRDGADLAAIVRSQDSES